jgi:hypothetical protein
MNPRAVRVVLATLIAGAIAVAMAPLALAGDQAGPDCGFVLLSMEQASLFSGTQVPAYCTGTSTYGECAGTSHRCLDYPEWDCPEWAVTYNSSPVHYCKGWVPGGPGDCQFLGEVVCYTDYRCEPVAMLGCVGTGYSFDSHRNDDVCTNPTPAPPGPELT